MRMRVHAAGILGVALSVASTGALGQTTTGPTVKPATVAAKAGTPPPANATPTKVAGKNKTQISTANHASDDDSIWIEKLDVDGDGDVEETSLVWDDEDKVLFAYSVGAFTCRNGGTATTELLVATFADGNPAWKRPAGSGFWIADCDKGRVWGTGGGLVGLQVRCEERDGLWRRRPRREERRAHHRRCEAIALDARFSIMCG